MDTLITVVDPSGARTDHRFSEEPITLGSAIANHLVCEEAEIAPHQLIIFRDRGRWMLRNLGPGAPLACGPNAIEPGASFALPAECEVTVGGFSVQWYAEAPPEGVRREFGAAELEPEPSSPAAPPRLAPESPASIEVGQLRRSGAARVIASQPGGATPSPEMPQPDETAAPLAGPSMAAPPAVTKTRPSAAPAPPLTKTFDRPSPLSGAEPLPSPPPLRPDPVKKGAPGQRRSARLPAPDVARSRSTPPDTYTTIAFSGFSRMSVARVHNVVVEIADANGLRVVPHFPGCAVTPTAARVESSGHVLFEVTPIAIGRRPHAGFDVVGPNGRPNRFEFPFRVVNSVTARVALWMGAVAVIAAWAALRNGWDLLAPTRDLLAPEPLESVDRAMAVIGGSPGLLLCASGLCVFASLVAFIRSRPRPIRVNAQPV